jgi:sulfite exporter TauE/SafE
MILRYLAEGFLLGLATGHLCLATCGPIYAPFLLERKLSWKGSFITLVKISIGRFATYVLFGIGAGFLGRQISEVNRSYFTAIAYCLFSTLLFLSAFRANQKEKGCVLPGWSRFADNPFLLGIATGINYCPSFLIALTRAVDISGPLSGGLLFAAFFFGTSLFLVPLIVFGVMGNKKILRLAGQFAAVLVGTWFLTQAVLFFVKPFLPAYRGAASGPPLVTLLDSTRAAILTTDTASFSLLKDRLSKKRPGPVAFAADTGSIAGAGYVFVDRNWPASTGQSFVSLKRSGRFVFVLPQARQPAGEAYADRLIVFLGKYWFKKSPGSAILFSPERFDTSSSVK